MATSGTLISSTRWSNENPAIYVSATYETKNRTSTTVDVRVVVSVSAVSGLSYFGYNIQSCIEFPGKTTDWATIKGNSPSQWTSPYTYDFGWNTISQAASSTSFSATVKMNSNSGKRTLNYSGTVKIDVGNTAPYWPSNAVAQFNSTSNALTVAENTSSVTYSWSAATDNEQNSILYRVEWFKNGVSQGNWKNDVTSRSFTVNPNVIGEGQNMFFRVYCRDGQTSYSSYKQSNTLTRNLLTPARINSAGSIRFDTTYFNIVRSTPSNLNGNTSFTYTLNCSEVTIYNASATGSGSTIRVDIWRSGSYPTGPYLRFSDIQDLVSSSGYTGSLTFTLSTKNAYALTDLLFCGECGTPYRRCTWVRKGGKKIVWRCISRLDYGTKYCKHSPSLEEYRIHAAIADAVTAYARQGGADVDRLKAHVRLYELQRSEQSYLIQKRLTELETAFSDLLKLSGKNRQDEQYDEALQKILEEKAVLSDRLQKQQAGGAAQQSLLDRIEHADAILEGLKNRPVEYDDRVIRQLVECVKVLSADKLLVCFYGGDHMEVPV